MKEEIVKLSKFSLLADKLCPIDMAQKRGNGWFLKKELFPTVEGDLIYKKHPGYSIYNGVAYPKASLVKVRTAKGTEEIPKSLATETVQAKDGTIYLNAAEATRCGLAIFTHKNKTIAIDKTPNKGYHSEARVKLQAKSSYFIGFEIEKEDDELYEEPADKVAMLTGWAKERDGSLNDNGFELISPAYGLPSRKLTTDLSNRYLVDLINAGHSSRCGGHINLSCVECTPLQLATDMRAFMPLLYAMFPKRASNQYCQAVPFEQVERGGRHALAIKSYAIEFRIFPAVRNITDLKHRIALINYFIKNRGISSKELLEKLDEVMPLCTAISSRSAEAIKESYKEDTLKYEGVCV